MTLSSLTGADITSLMGAFWWPFIRLSALFTTMPFFGDRVQNVKVRLMIALIIAIVMAPMMPPMPKVDPFSATAILMTLEQIAFGFFLGLMLHMLFGVMSMLGQILSLQMGLAMGIMNDPANGQAVPLISHLMIIFGAFLFFILNGHLIAIDIIVESFFTWPPGSSVYDLNLTAILVMFGWMFASALLLAMPAVLAMLIVNLTFGVMNRSAPALNIIALGFPLSMMMGILSILLTLSGIPSQFTGFTNHVLNEMRQLASGI